MADIRYLFSNFFKKQGDFAHHWVRSFNSGFGWKNFWRKMPKLQSTRFHTHDHLSSELKNVRSQACNSSSKKIVFVIKQQYLRYTIIPLSEYFLQEFNDEVTHADQFRMRSAVVNVWRQRSSPRRKEPTPP